MITLNVLEVRIMVRAFELRVKRGESFEAVAEDYPRLTVDDLAAIRATLTSKEDKL